MKHLVIFLAATILASYFPAFAQDGGAASGASGGRFKTKDAIVISRPARDGESARLAVAADLRTIATELKTDKTTYTEGEELVITVRAAESGHLRLLYQNAAGEIYTLFPNQFIEDDRIEGGQSVRVMPTRNPKKPGDDVAIQIAGPNFGAEYLAAIVSNQPFANEGALREQLRSAIFPKSQSPTLVAAITKDARVISRLARTEVAAGATASAGFAILTLTTVRK